jgi:hypothetical protein
LPHRQYRQALSGGPACPVFHHKESIMRNLISDKMQNVYGGCKGKDDSQSHSKSKSCSRSKSDSKSRSKGNSCSKSNSKSLSKGKGKRKGR